MDYHSLDSLPVKLTDFKLDEAVASRLTVVKWQNLGASYQGWVLDCSCENDNGQTRVFALFEGDVFFSEDDVKNWFRTLEPESKNISLIQHKSKEFDVTNISSKMRDPIFFAELSY